MKTWLFGALSIVLSVAVALVGLELVVRWSLDDGMQYDLEMWKYAIDHKQVSDIPGAGHVHVPGTQGHLMGVDVSINGLGQRGPERSQAKPDTVFRVLLLGDSTTFGWGVASDETMAARVQAALQHRYPDRRIEVINAGVGNTNTEMQVAWYLSEGRALEPDLLVLNYFINDAELTPSRQGGWLRESSMAFIYFEGRLDTMARQFLGKVDWEQYYRDLYADDAAGWRRAKEAISRLIEGARADGTRMLITHLPEVRRLSPYPFPEVEARISQIASENDVAYLDLHSSVESEAPESLWVSVEDPHPNGKANRLFAAALTERLIGSSLLNP